MKVNDTMWHPCNMDIIEHKIISIHKFETETAKGVKHFTQYNLRAVHNVGACGRVEVIISENNGAFRFIELVDEDDIEYSSGLRDFIEGNYYATENEARLEFYKQQEILAWSRMTKNEQIFKESKIRYDQVKLLIKTIREDIKDEKA